MADVPDPRVYFAAERTLLAWIRTGLAVIGLGFVVARFGLFLRMLRNGPDVGPHVGSTLIGVGLVAMGSVAIGIAARQHATFARSFGEKDRPAAYPLAWPIVFAGAVSAIGFALAVYLMLRAWA
jgi:putative membrane protein